MCIEAKSWTLANFAAAPTDPLDLLPHVVLLTMGVSQMLAPYIIVGTATALYSWHEM